MFCLKGYNQMLKKWIEMKILDDGTVLADDWEHIEEGSIKRYTRLMKKRTACCICQIHRISMALPVFFIRKC